MVIRKNNKERKNTLLAVDIGNSSINIGVFVGRQLFAKSRIPTHPEKTEVFYGKKVRSFISKNRIVTPLGGVILSSVVPERSKAFHRAVKDLSIRKPIMLGASKNVGLNFDVEKPNEVGADRIANAAAAIELSDTPVLVVDFGTATTITAIKNRRFLGGSIMPGLGLMGNVLYTGTSKLPMVDFGSRKTKISAISAVGKNTTKSMISGIIYGTAGAVERLVDEMEKVERCRFKVILTGGYAGIIGRFLKRRHRIDHDLTLKGLRLIYERNTRCMS